MNGRFKSELTMCCALLVAVLVNSSTLMAQDISGSELVIYQIKPSATDAAITRFDEPHYVIFSRNVAESADLVVFLPGTNGKPSNTATLLGVIATQGYRVIGLEYNDEPAVVQICPRDPNPTCSESFREKRIFGTNVKSPVENSSAESIVNRLVKALTYLNQQHPEQHWDRYIADGAPVWSHIVVSGLSQGAGMAAYIAKSKSVARVVLFSSPWDFYGKDKTLAPWISKASITPRDRWYAAFHRRENTAELIARAYKALNIPGDHIRMFNLDLPPNRTGGDNPFHGAGIRQNDYEPEWRFLFGHATQ